MPVWNHFVPIFKHIKWNLDSCKAKQISICEKLYNDEGKHMQNLSRQKQFQTLPCLHNRMHVICWAQNHRIMKVGEDLQDHQVQPSTESNPLKPYLDVPRLLGFLTLLEMVTPALP